ncbi:MULTISPECIES: TolB family protein [Kitasatospora]|uniref:WD40 repeat protein n=1 Tax=Kitasatospora cystarginea TaxID=58350 RepID=A0ABN3E109_9ACTN
MSTRNRLRSAVAVALTATSAALLTIGAATAANAATAPKGLTISNGTKYVVINGKQVDFGVPVRDLAWSPDGSKAAFIDGADGSLVVSAANGSHRVVVAKNPGHQIWSHPTWQVAAADTRNHVPAKNNIIFAATKGGVATLQKVPATAVNGKPVKLPLNTFSGPDEDQLPQTGNLWPNAGGKIGSIAYANTGTGDVYIRDEYLRQEGGSLTKGSQPALSPDGDKVVFVRSVDGHDHLFERDLHSQAPTDKDLTPGSTRNYVQPTWSPDGKTIAARTTGGIATVPADGSAKPALVSTHTGMPAFRR